MGPKKKNKETIEQRHVKEHIINSSTMVHTIVTPLRLWLIFKQIFVSRRESYQLKTPNSSTTHSSLPLSQSLCSFSVKVSLSLSKLPNFNPQMASVLNTVPSLRLSNINNTNRVRTRQVFTRSPVSFTSEFTPQYFLYFVPFDYPKNTRVEKRSWSYWPLYKTIQKFQSYLLN